MRCVVAQICQGMIWYELETWWDRDYRPTRPDALILTHRNLSRYVSDDEQGRVVFDGPCACMLYDTDHLSLNGRHGSPRVRRRRQPTGRLISTSLGQTLRQCKIAQATLASKCKCSLVLSPHFISHSLFGRQVTETRVRIRQRCLLTLISSTPSIAPPMTPTPSGPITCRVFWPVCLRYTHLKPPRHLNIVANKRCLLLRLRLCNQCWRVRVQRPWLLTTTGCSIPFRRAVVSASTISVPDPQTPRTPGRNDADHGLPFIKNRDRLSF